MCLAVPMKVVEIEGPIARVEAAGVRREARVDLVEGVKVGDYVIVHAGIAIERLEPEEARETLRLLEEMLRAAAKRAAPQDENGSSGQA
jgi:hydrogenase expression/formation protein HypC